MAAIVFDFNAFIAAYPAFRQTPEATLAAYWTAATNFINSNNYGCTSAAKRGAYLNLMTAHLAAISDIIASGQTPGMTTGATIDKVAVTLQPPPERNQFQWWLNLTPYGMQLLALLQANSVGGFYVGGRPELCGFRRIGGRF